MADQCPKCGYAMDPFDETCKRCANLKALPEQPTQAPPTIGAPVPDNRGKAVERMRRETAAKASRGAWAVAIIFALLGGFLTVAAPYGWCYWPIAATWTFETSVRKMDDTGVSPAPQRWTYYTTFSVLAALLLYFNSFVLSKPLAMHSPGSRPSAKAATAPSLPTGGNGARTDYLKQSSPNTPVGGAYSAQSSGTGYRRPRPNPATVVRQAAQGQLGGGANPELLREKQQADQMQRNLAAGMRPMYPPRTQPPNWIPRGQTAGHWVGSGSSTGEDSWVWVDANGRQVGQTVFSRPGQ